MEFRSLSLKMTEKKEGAFRESNSGPLAPKARIIPLDQMPLLKSNYCPFLYIFFIFTFCFPWRSLFYLFSTSGLAFCRSITIILFIQFAFSDIEIFTMTILNICIFWRLINKESGFQWIHVQVLLFYILRSRQLQSLIILESFIQEFVYDQGKEKKPLKLFHNRSCLRISPNHTSRVQVKQL